MKSMSRLFFATILIFPARLLVYAAPPALREADATQIILTDVRQLDVSHGPGVGIAYSPPPAEPMANRRFTPPLGQSMAREGVLLETTIVWLDLVSFTI